MAAVNLATAMVTIKANAKQLAGGLSAAKALLFGWLKPIHAAVSGMTFLFGTVFKWVSILGSALGGLSIATAVRLAADAQEMNALFKQVFKSMSMSAREFSDTLAVDLGRSIFDVRKAMAGFQNVLVPMGIARREAAHMSKELTKLALDQSAARNVNFAETADLMRSAIVGNHRAVRRFGIVLTEAALKQELMNMGMKGNLAKAEATSKAIARMNIMFRNSRDVIGQAAREASFFAARWMALRGIVHQSMVTIGNAFIGPQGDAPWKRGGLTIVTANLVKLLQEVQPKLQAISEETRKWGVVMVKNWDETWQLVKKGANVALSLIPVLVRTWAKIVEQEMVPMTTTIVPVIAKLFWQLGRAAIEAFKLGAKFSTLAGFLTKGLPLIMGQVTGRGPTAPIKKSVQELFAESMDEGAKAGLADFAKTFEQLELKKIVLSINERMAQALAEHQAKLLKEPPPELETKLGAKIDLINFDRANEKLQEAFSKQIDPQEKILKEAEQQTMFQRKMHESLDAIKSGRAVLGPGMNVAGA